MSRRYATFLLAAIVITDKIADSLLAGLPVNYFNPGLGGYDCENTTKMLLSDSIFPEKIRNEVKIMDNIYAGKVCYFALPYSMLIHVLPVFRVLIRY